MNIGVLTATLGIDASTATAGMSTFQRQMLLSVAKINASLDTITASFTKMGTSINSAGTIAAAGMNKITVASQRASTGTASFAAKINAANVASATLGSPNPIVTPAGGKVTTPTVTPPPVITPIVDTKPALINIAKMTAGFMQFAQRVRTFGYLSSAVITLPITMIGKSILDLAKDYEYLMQKTAGLTSASQGMVDEWSAGIIELAPKVGKGPKELADAMYFIASSAFKGAKGMEVLELSAKAATAGLGETKDISMFLTSALNAYAGTALTATKATEILIAGVREGKVEASSFTNAIGSVIPIASEMGVSLDQLVGAMAAITLTGSTASQAATYLKGFFNMLNKTDDVGRGAKALDEMGSSYEELRTILKTGPHGIIDVMQKMRDMQAEYGETLAMRVLPNIRALTGFLSIAGKNFKYNTEAMSRVTDSAGSLARAFEAVSNTIKVRMDRAVANMQVGLIKLGQSLATVIVPIMEKWAQRINNLGKWFDSLTEAQKRHKIMLVVWIAAMGPISLMLSFLVYTITGAISVIAGFWNTLKYGRLVILAVVESFQGLTAATVANTAANIANAESAVAAAAANGKAASGMMLMAPNLTKILSSPWLWATVAITGATLAIKNFITESLKVPKFDPNDPRTATEKIKETHEGLSQTSLNKLTEAQNILASDQTYGTKAIMERTKLLSDMSADQLKQFKNDVDTRIQLEKDRNIELLKLMREGVANDKYINEQRNIAQENGKKATEEYERFMITMRKKGYVLKGDENKFDLMQPIQGEGGKNEVLQFIQQSYQAYKRLEIAAVNNINKYKKDVIEKAKGLQIDIPLVIKNLTFDKTKIEEELKKVLDPIEIAAKAQERIDTSNKTVKEASFNLQDQLQFIKDKEKLFKELGITYDVNAEKLQALTTAFDIFVKEGLTPADERLRSVMKQLKELNGLEQVEAHKKFFKETEEKLVKSGVSGTSFKEGTEYTPDYKKLFSARKGAGDQAFLQSFQKELDLIALESKVLGESFNAARNQANYFRTVLEKLWDAGVEPGSPLMKTLTERMKEFTLRADAIDIMKDAFTNFFMIGEEGFNNFGKYIEKWAQSVLVAFQRLAAGLIAQKIIELIFPNNKKINDKTLIGSTLALAGAETAKSAVMSASIPVTNAAALAARQLAVAEAAAAAAWVPWPGNMAAVVASIGAVTAEMAAGAAIAASIGAIVPGMKEGGIVPAGYPNDTYPAMLSSKEMVVPPGKLPELGKQPVNVELSLDSMVKGKDLMIILRRAQSYN
jgi:TP901 family phage tail tape measure protein